MMVAVSISSICPFTLKSLNTTRPEDTAFVYKSNPLLVLAKNSDCMRTTEKNDASVAEKVGCGHSCTLSHLVSYIHDNSGGTTKQCPVCQSSPANVICDGLSNAQLAILQSNADDADEADDNNGRIICFRYGATLYYLWVNAKPIQSLFLFSGSTKESNAIHRIGTVLGMDVNKMKLIHKGKVIYPTTGESSADLISEQLFDISSADIIHHRKKPSLVVMGLRKQQITTAMRTQQQQPSKSNTIDTIASLLSPWYIFQLITIGFSWTFSTTKSILGGVVLFAQSILYHPTRPMPD